MRGRILDCVRHNKIIVALRNVPSDKIERTAEALYQGGIRMLEVTFNQADEAGIEKTCRAIEAVRRCMGTGLMVGAGTVMSVEQLAAAGAAGAEYMLAPNFNPKVVAEAVRRDIPAIPGAFTPSEIAAAWEAGAELVKVFPVGALGGSYLKALSAPLNHIPLLGMGGIDQENLAAYLSFPNIAGVGIGSNIARTDLILKNDFAGLSELAGKYSSISA